MKKIDKDFLGWIVALVILGAAILLLDGCKSATKIEKEYIHDTTRVVDVRFDSIDRWHTHYEYSVGETIRSVDTFYFDRWHLRTDTVERAVVSYKDREVVKIEERKVYVWWPFAALLVLVLSVILFYKYGRTTKN